MKRIRSSLLSVSVSALFLCFISFSPADVDAAEHNVPKDFATIQAAISSPTFTTGDTITVDPGTYVGPITLVNNVTIKGKETARTFLSGDGGPIVTANGTISATIQNFTFIKASSGIQILNNSSPISIMNNVFQVGPGGTAVTIQGSPTARVTNNTFYQNGTALNTDSDIPILNNIFANNSVAIIAPIAGSTNISNNDFSGNGDINSGPTGTHPVLANPSFVAPGLQDFHLREGSPCIDAGNSSTGSDIADGSVSDIGAYGGPSADTFPFPVAGLDITSSTDTSIALSWQPNNSYLVTSTTNTNGGYKVYLGVAPGDYSCTLASCGTGSSPIDVKQATSYTLTDLTSPSTPLDAPNLDPPSPRDSRLVLTWSAVSGATGYQVHYGISSPNEHGPIDVGNNTSYELSELTNNQTYRVAVSAYSRRTYFIAVTAYDNTTASHESAYSTPVSRQIGSTMESGLSNVQSDFPEAVTTYPALPDSGGRCFIATAAFGYYSAPEVQALRVFRDRYLLPSAPGRIFVQWYYRYGPAAAALLNDHPGCKPVVRAALMPVVGAAIFMTETSMVFKVIMFLAFGAAIVFGFFRNKPSRSGGPR